MKIKQGQKPIFIEIGRNIASSKPQSRNYSHSFASSKPLYNQIAPTFIPQVNKTQPLLANKPRLTQQVSSANKTSTMVSNINDDFLFMRKQNYLNTKFNIRKQKLKEITKQNKQIHEKISSQKSFYSSTDLNKSFQSTKQIKKRLSQSKISQRLNSSRSSSRSKLPSGNRFEKKQQQKIAIKTTNINETESKDLQIFKGLFKNQVKSVKNSVKSQKQSFQFKTFRVNDAYARPLKPPSALFDSNYSRNQGKMMSEGGLLHRIAEEMIKGKDKKGQQKKKYSYLKTKKPFDF